MARFTNRVLRELDSLYQFISGEIEAPDQVDTEGRITLVHDVSKMVGQSQYNLDRRTGGWIHNGQDNVHAAADTQANQLDPYAALVQEYGADASDRMWCWLMKMGVTASAAVFGAANTVDVILSNPKVGNAAPARNLHIAQYNKTLSIADAAFDPTQIVALQSTLGLPVVPGLMPLWLPPGCRLVCQSSSTGAGTARFNFWCWVAPIGVLPPGL